MLAPPTCWPRPSEGTDSADTATLDAHCLLRSRGPLSHAWDPPARPGRAPVPHTRSQPPHCAELCQLPENPTLEAPRFHT